MGKLKAHIGDYLKNKSRRIDWDTLEEYSAAAMALKLDTKRNVVSHYLNEMYSESKLIKINTRPVLYFYHKTIERTYSVNLSNRLFASIEEFKQAIGHKKDNSVFCRLIGWKDSLSHCVEQCKAAMLYPDNGLPILLHGAPGTGKSFIAQLMYDYAKKKKIIPPEGKFLTVNCAEYSNNPELFSTSLFGYKKGAFTGADDSQKGLLALADNGILFMDEIHGLAGECQEKVFLFLDKGIYHMVGDNETWYKSKARVIFATTENPSDVLLKTLLRRIPIMVSIPSLEERSIKEKKEIIFNILLDEEIKLNKRIYISRLAYQLLLNFKYTGNIGQMLNVIKATVANVFINHAHGQELRIQIHNLPSELIETSSNIMNNPKEDQIMIEASALSNIINTDSKLYILNQAIIKLANQLQVQEITIEEFLKHSYEQLEQYINYLFFNENKIDKYTEKVKVNLLTNISNIISENYSPFSFSNHEITILARFVIDYMKLEDNCHIFVQQYKNEIINCLEIFQRNYQLKSNIIEDFLQLLSESSILTNSSLSKLYLFLFLSYFKRNFMLATTPGIIIAHGYSIASGIAEVTNQLLNQHIYDAIDMPLDSDITSVTKKLTEYLKMLQDCDEIIVLVDMGSLEVIHEQLESQFNMNIGIINNITTRTALNIGNMIIQKQSMEEILEKACSQNTNKFSIIKNKRRQDVILIVCETGIDTANKIIDLFKQSLPVKIDTIIMPYDFENLQTIGKKLSLFEKYNIICMIGTKNPNIEEVPFIPIEDLIEWENKHTIYKLFQGKLSYEQTRLFNQNIVKNFSLYNLIGYLNILNPHKIIKSIENIICNLQKELNIILSSGTILGLYIHIGCLIERLIIEEHVINYEDLEKFKEKNARFIEIAKKLFLKIEISYNINIPDSELAYLHDYIYYQKRPSVTKIQNSVNSLSEFND